MAPHDKTELRVLCPLELAQALDAIAMAKGMDRSQKPFITSSGLFYKRATWEKLLRRWATVGRSPESEFLIAVIAQAIEDKATGDRSSGLPVTFAPSFLESAIPSYCACIGVDPQFLLEQCNKAFAMEVA